jgi:hypothetical protein
MNRPKRTGQRRQIEDSSNDDKRSGKFNRAGRAIADKLLLHRLEALNSAKERGEPVGVRGPAHATRASFPAEPSGRLGRCSTSFRCHFPTFMDVVVC